MGVPPDQSEGRESSSFAAPSAESVATGVTHTATSGYSPAPDVPESQALQLRALDNRCDRERYHVLGEHGRGGLGKVLRAHDQQLGRDVAIKELISRGAVSERRFAREAAITRAGSPGHRSPPTRAIWRSRPTAISR